jgi:DNA-binding LacI/PurR family transcriptional regulator
MDEQLKNAPVPGGRTRLIDVADLAGVTKSVASRVLNNDQTLSVRDETRLRVLDSAQRLGYQPHAGARALAGARTRALALLIPDLTNPVYSRITRGAYREARRRGYALLLAEDTADEGVTEEFAGLVASGRVDGLLIASARPGHPLLTALPKTDIPYLDALGHRNIGHVAGPERLSPSRSRRLGLERAAREAGLPAPVVEAGEYNEQGGYDATIRLVQAHPELTAIYTSTLNQAIGTLHALHKLGLRVPEQVSVISYDELPLAEYLEPPLTTVAMPLLELGIAAVDALCAQLQGEPARDITIPSDPKVIVRSSTGPVAASGTAAEKP